jgi:hypothetical protein
LFWKILNHRSKQIILGNAFNPFNGVSFGRLFITF